MKRLAKLLALAALLALFVVLTTPIATAQAPVTLSLYDPTGAFQVTQTFAARVPDLNGKVVCEITNGSWQAERTFALIRELLQKQFPTAKLIPFDQFPKLLTGSDVAGLEDAVKKAGCQAAIIGNAG